MVYKNIGFNDEWIIQAHMDTDYSSLNDDSFIQSIKEHLIFSTKLELGLLDKDLDEITILEILNQNNISAFSMLENIDAD